METDKKIKSIEVWSNRYNVYIDVVEKIQRKRIDYGYTQEDLAILLNLPVQDVAAIEKFDATKEYTFTNLYDLADIFNFNVNQFFKDHPKKAKKIEVGVFDWYEKSDLRHFEVYISCKKSYQLLYSLREEIKRYPKVKQTISEIDECFNFMTRTDFFDRGVRFPEIFKYCRESIYDDFAPRHVLQVLNRYLKNGVPRQLCKKRKDRNTFYFKKSKLPTNKINNNS